jgi:hypothetical protein
LINPTAAVIPSALRKFLREGLINGRTSGRILFLLSSRHAPETGKIAVTR